MCWADNDIMLERGDIYKKDTGLQEAIDFGPDGDAKSRVSALTTVSGCLWDRILARTNSCVIFQQSDNDNTNLHSFRTDGVASRLKIVTSFFFY